jgi:hypothetical protein
MREVSVVRTGVSQTGRAIVARLEAQLAAETRVVVDGRAATAVLGCSESYLLKLAEEGKVASFTDGSRRVYTTASLYAYLIEQAARSHPAGAAPTKIPRPIHRRPAKAAAVGAEAEAPSDSKYFSSTANSEQAEQAEHAEHGEQGSSSLRPRPLSPKQLAGLATANAARRREAEARRAATAARKEERFQRLTRPHGIGGTSSL